MMARRNSDDYVAWCNCQMCQEIRERSRIRRIIVDGIMREIGVLRLPEPYLHPSQTHKRGPIEERQQKEPLDEVQMELVRADIALLKAEAEKSGAMEKWRREQERLMFL
jgi:hypothetical protein